MTSSYLLFIHSDIILDRKHCCDVMGAFESVERFELFCQNNPVVTFTDSFYDTASRVLAREQIRLRCRRCSDGSATWTLTVPLETWHEYLRFDGENNILALLHDYAVETPGVSELGTVAASAGTLADTFPVCLVTMHTARVSGTDAEHIDAVSWRDRVAFICSSSVRPFLRFPSKFAVAMHDTDPDAFKLFFPKPPFLEAGIFQRAGSEGVFDRVRHFIFPVTAGAETAAC